MSDPLKLWAVIHGDGSNVFSIQVSPTDVVYTMNVKTKEEKDGPLLAGLGSGSMVLWKLRHPLHTDDNLEDNIKGIDLPAQADKMFPPQRVSEYFPDQPSMDHLHIIVQLAQAQPSEIQQAIPHPQMDDSTLNDYAVAKGLHGALWGTDFESLLRPCPVEPSLNYIQMDQFGVRFPRFKEHILLIRDEYTEAFSTMEHRAHVHGGGGGAVLTGQPGIGKTCFLFYALIRRLTAKLPTAFQAHPETFFLFTEDGAFVYPTDQRYMIPPGTWALADSNNATHKPCMAFLSSDESNVWVLQASSPRASRWNDWARYRDANLYVMNHISTQELRALGDLLNLDAEKLLLHFNTWSPSTRICIQLERGFRNIAGIQRDIVEAAEVFVNNPTFVIRAAESLEFVDGTSSILFAIKPEVQNRECHLIQIASNHILGLIRCQAAGAEPTLRRDFLSKIQGYPWLQGLADWLFEKFVYIRLTAHPNGAPLGTTPANQDSPLVIPVCRNILALYDKDGLKDANKQTSTFYWRPSTKSFTSFDAIICTPSAIILLQATISDTHGISHNDLENIRVGIPSMFFERRKWCLVFITDTKEKAECLRTQPFLGDLKPAIGKKLHVYSCVFEIGQRNLTLQEKKAWERITM